MEPYQPIVTWQTVYYTIAFFVVAFLFFFWIIGDSKAAKRIVRFFKREEFDN